MEKMYEILTECPLFRGMDAAQIEEVLSSDDVSITSFNKGEVVAHKDLPYSGLMIILKGKASGKFTSPSGEITTIDSIEAPQLIAPAFLFGGYNRLPVDMIADTDVDILTLHRGYLFELMQENTLILSNFIDIISNRAGMWQKRIYALSYKTLQEKLAAYLLENSTPAKMTVRIPDIKQIADVFGATRSALSSVIDGLERKRIIFVDNGKIIIQNRAALVDILK